MSNNNLYAPIGEQKPETSVAPDLRVSQTDAVEYWSTVSTDVTGMLGGYPQVSKVDLQASSNFLTKLRRRRAGITPADRTQKQLLPIKRAVDCGAGIGRITAGLLSKVADVVDIVEPVKAFTDQISHGQDFATLREQGKIGKVYTQGSESWVPEEMYDLIWFQWCLGQLRDAQVVEALKRCIPNLIPGGWVIVKENISTDLFGGDVFDETDSSVTRTDEKLRTLISESGLTVVASDNQKGFPKDLFPVKMFALQPLPGRK